VGTALLERLSPSPVQKNRGSCFLDIFKEEKDMFQKMIIVLVGLMVLLAACASPAATPTVEVSVTDAPVFPLSLEDGLGRTVILPGRVQRIVSLTPATTEILFAIGAGSQVVGRDMFSDFPEESLSVADVGGSWGEYNTEAIVSLQPDLILAGGINPPELVANLENLGLTVYFLANPTTLEGLYTNLQVLGRMTGNEKKAAELTSSLDARVRTVDQKLAGITDEVEVYYELEATPFTAGPGTFVDQLIARAGGTNFGAKMDSAWAQVSLEQLLLADPDIIILGDSAYGETPESVAARPGWASLAAVREQHIFPFDDNLVSRPGPRLVDGLEALARLIHPEVFK
jgi:iron complex transport system substrate-binding protein